MAQGSPDVVAYAVLGVLVITASPDYDLWIRDGGNWENANPGPVNVQAPNVALASGPRDRYRAASGITVQLHTGSIPPPSGAQDAPIGGPITTAFLALCLAAVAASGWRRAVARR